MALLEMDALNSYGIFDNVYLTVGFENAQELVPTLSLVCKTCAAPMESQADVGGPQVPGVLKCQECGYSCPIQAVEEFLRKASKSLLDVLEMYSRATPRKRWWQFWKS